MFKIMCALHLTFFLVVLAIQTWISWELFLCVSVSVSIFRSLGHNCSLKPRFLQSLESELSAQGYFLNALSAFLREDLSLMRDRCETVTREDHTCPAGQIWAAIDPHVIWQKIRILTKPFRNLGQYPSSSLSCSKGISNYIWKIWPFFWWKNWDHCRTII